MNSTAPTAARPPRGLGTLAIPIVAVSCFSVHVVLLVATGTTMLAMALSMLALSALCVACNWRVGAHMIRDHLVAVAAGISMVVVHLMLMPSGADSVTGGMDHGGMDHAGVQMASANSLLPAAAVDLLMQVGVALAVVQVVLAVGAVVRLSSRVVA